MNKENRVMCRLDDDELKQLRRKAGIEEEGNVSLTMRRALKFYLSHDIVCFTKGNEEEMELFESVRGYCLEKKISMSIYLKQLLLRDSPRRDYLLTKTK